MIKSSFIFQLADTLSKQMGKAPLASVTPVSMYPDEQGYSGAKLVRLNCTFSDGKTGSDNIKVLSASMPFYRKEWSCRHSQTKNRHTLPFRIPMEMKQRKGHGLSCRMFAPRNPSRRIRTCGKERLRRRLRISTQTI